jgi:IMP cyclohydrolase
MYVGRFVVVGPETAAYRVSSRSFPNRQIVDRDGTLTVVPTPEADETDNPYVSYNCIRTTSGGAVVGNGSHVDPIAEKLELGYPARDALAESLLALDYEKDDYDTPRIAGVLAGERATTDGAGETESYIATVRRDALIVQPVTEPTLVATYEKDSPEPWDLEASDAAGAAREVYEADLEHRVCAAGVSVDGDAFETAIHNGD